MLTDYEIDKLAEAIIKRMPQKDEILTVKDVADMLDLSMDAVRTRCSRGQLPFHKKSGTLYFSKNEITEYILKK